MPRRRQKTVPVEVQEPETGEEVVSAGQSPTPDPIREIEARVKTLSAQQLLTVRDLVEKQRKRMVAEEKQKFLQEIKGKLSALGLSLNDLVPVKRTERKNPPRMRVKYRSPDGQTWSGTGHVPLWVRQLEAEGHSREEYAAAAIIGSPIGK